jgi:hypothetical protein
MRAGYENPQAAPEARRESKHLPQSIPPFAFLPPEHQFLARGSGYTLEVAVRVGTPETVELLLAHGAKIEYARPLRLLIRRPFAQLSPQPSAAAAAPDPARFQFANHLVRRGVDVNPPGMCTSSSGCKVMYDMRFRVPLLTLPASPILQIPSHSETSAIANPGFIMVTSLSLAVGVRDWDFVEWLLENGADAEAHR